MTALKILNLCITEDMRMTYLLCSPDHLGKFTSLPVNMNRKIKKPPVKLNFRASK